MPVFTRARLHNPGFGGFTDQPLAQHVDFEHQGFDVACQNDVAAAAQDELGRGFQGRISQNRINIGQTLQANQRQSLGNNAKGIKRLKRNVFLD